MSGSNVSMWYVSSTTERDCLQVSGLQVSGLQVSGLQVSGVGTVVKPSDRRPDRPLLNIGDFVFDFVRLSTSLLSDHTSSGSVAHRLRVCLSLYTAHYVDVAVHLSQCVCWAWQQQRVRWATRARAHTRSVRRDRLASHRCRPGWRRCLLSCASPSSASLQVQVVLPGARTRCPAGT